MLFARQRPLALRQRASSRGLARGRGAVALLSMARGGRESARRTALGGRCAPSRGRRGSCASMTPCACSSSTRFRPRASPISTHADSASTRRRARSPGTSCTRGSPDYEAIITRSSTAVTAEFLARARKLRILGRAGVGVDNIDVEACSRHGVVVVNAPYGNVVSAAEHTIGMLLALVRKIPFANDSLKRGDLGPRRLRRRALPEDGRRVGLGKVGSRVATRLRAFEMDVLVYDPYIPESRARELGVRLTDFQTVLAESDVLTVHVPLNDETENMIAAREIAADEARRAHRQLRARRDRARGRPAGGARVGASGRGRARCLERGAAGLTARAPAGGASARGRHAAPGSEHPGGAGQRRGGRRAPARGVSRRRARGARGQHPGGRPRDDGRAAPLPPARASCSAASASSSSPTTSSASRWWSRGEWRGGTRS